MTPLDRAFLVYLAVLLVAHAVLAVFVQLGIRRNRRFLAECEKNLADAREIKQQALELPVNVLAALRRGALVMDAQRAENEKLVAALYAAMPLIDGTGWWSPEHPALALVRAALEARP